MNEQTATYTHSTGTQTVTVLGHNGEDMTHVRFESGIEVWVCDSDLTTKHQHGANCPMVNGYPEYSPAHCPSYSGITEASELDSWRGCSHRADYASGAEHWQSCPAHGKDVQPAAGPREWAPLQAGDTVLARWDVALGQWTPAAWLNEANAEQYTVVKLSPAGADGMLVRKFLRGQSGPRVWITQGQYIRRPADALADTDDHLCTEDCANQPGHNL